MSTLLVRSHITLNLSRPNSGVVVYAKQFDKDSRIIDINLVNGAEVWDPPVDTEMVVMYAKPDGTKGVYDQLEDNSTPAIVKLGEGHIQLTLAEQALTAAGNVFVEISFYTSVLRSTTLSFILAVESGVPKNEDLMSDDYFNILSELIQGLLGATVNPPQIDPVTKNWMLWNKTLNRYEVSDYSSVGTKGDKGDQGWSIVSVTKTGGTGAEGTVDTYTMRNDNPSTSQQVVGTFNVYNGRDGSGAKGSRVPLADGGTGSAGELEIYSSEDHRHPLNVSDATPQGITSTPSAGEASTYARSDHSHSYGNIINYIYPVGSIYLSLNENFDPNVAYDGTTWIRLENRFLVGAGGLYDAGDTGGETTHMLTLYEMPAHRHRVAVRGYNAITTDDAITNAAYNYSTGGAAGYAGTILESVGGNVAHNNMPPYLAVYMWERTA